MKSAGCRDEAATTGLADYAAVVSDGPSTCQHCGARHGPEVKTCPRTDESMTSPGLLDRQLDRYRVQALLGTGSFSAVYRAQHVHTGALVALKVLKRKLESTGDDTVVERFLREARSAATVGSEHIVHVVDAGRTNEGLTFLALEYLEGEGLDAIEERGPVPLPRAVDLGLQVLEGLAATHRAGIIHRDMKPANVFVVQRSGRDFVKLLDFGISKIHAEDVRALTMTGVAMGTPSFMAPEQFVDAKSVDERADLYSVAVMLFELLAGRKPLISASYAEAVMNARFEEPPALWTVAPTVSKAISDCVMKGLAKKKEQRWASATEFATALTSALNERTRQAAQRPLPPNAEPRTVLDSPPPPAWQAKTVLDAKPAPPRPPVNEPTIPPEAAAFLRPVVPHWLLVVIALAVIGGLIALFVDSPAPAPLPTPSPSKLEEDHAPPSEPVLKPEPVPIKPTKRR
ncbi:MAG: protein kinase [Myxococcales bacterium]|nr:protein kinase [Myxococcales bacterium]